MYIAAAVSRLNMHDTCLHIYSHAYVCVCACVYIHVHVHVYAVVSVFMERVAVWH